MKKRVKLPQIWSIVIIGCLLISCSSAIRAVFPPEYVIRSELARINANNQKLYITKPCIAPICTGIYIKLSEEIKKYNDIIIVDNPEQADHIISIDAKLFLQTNEDQIAVIKNYLTYASLSPEVVFDNNNTPHIKENQSIVDIMGNSKELSRDGFYNNRTLASLSTAGITGFSAFLIPGVAAIPIAGAASIAVGGLTYILVDQLQSIGTIGSFEITVLSKESNSLQVSRKSVRKIGSNGSEEQFYSQKSNYTNSISNIYVLATGSRLISGIIMEDIATIISASITQILKK